jgi:hypothetical protein
MIGSRPWLAVEFLLLFFGVPWAMASGRLPRQPILVLAIASVACVIVLLLDPTFDRSLLWNARAVRTHGRAIVIALVTLGPLLYGVALWLARDERFLLARQRPLLWIAILIFYPILSVYPQEVIYRAFLFHRYAPLFRQPALLWIASATAFSFAHLFFRTPWVAMSLCLVGGALFAYHFDVSRSLAVVCVEHAVFGQLIFTVGLGRYFYHAA